MCASGCPIRIIACGCKMNSEGQDSMELIIRSNNNKTKSNSHVFWLCHSSSFIIIFLFIIIGCVGSSNNYIRPMFVIN